MKRTAIFAAIMAGLLLAQQIVYATPLYGVIFDYFAHHSLRYEVYRAFWMLVRLSLIGVVGLSFYKHRRHLPLLQKGHKWFTLLLAAAFTYPLIWSMLQPNYSGTVTYCYTDSYFIIALWALLTLWFVLLARTNYEHFVSEGVGLLGIIGVYSAAVLLILSAHSALTLMRHHFFAGWHSDALVSWVLPGFIAALLWIYGLANLRKP